MCEAIAYPHLTKSIYLDEDENFSWRYKYHAKMWSIFFKPYRKWGTFYTIDLDAWKIDAETQELLSRLGSDYDEDGVPYWENEGGPVKDIEERLKYMEENGI
jgi:hypothetical protein